MTEEVERDVHRAELERIKRVSDMLCTAHASLRDRYRFIAVMVEIVVLIATFLLTVVALADQELLAKLLNRSVNVQLWSGLAGVLIFGLTLAQLTLRWRERAEAHEKSHSMYAEVKREATYLLIQGDPISPKEFQRLADRYDIVTNIGTSIPDRKFLHLKRRHELKVAISRRISERPGASVLIERIKLTFRDNFWVGKDGQH